MNYEQREALLESVGAIEEASGDLATVLAHDGYAELLGSLLNMVKHAIKNADHLKESSDKDIEDVIDGILQEGHVGRLHHTIKEAQKELSFASDTVDRVRDEIERDQWLASMDAAVQASQATLHA